MRAWERLWLLLSAGEHRLAAAAGLDAEHSLAAGGRPSDE
jgi:hypothetical protein